MNSINDVRLIDEKDLRKGLSKELGNYMNALYTKEFEDKVEDATRYYLSDIEQDDLLQMREAFDIHKYRSGFDGCIYFLMDTRRGLIKIGMTSNLRNRLSNIRNAFENCGIKNNLKLIACFMCRKEYIKKMEKYFHKMFSEFLYCGEWYKLSSFELLSKLNALNDVEYIFSSVHNGTYYFTFDLYNKFINHFNDETELKCSYYLIQNRFDPYYKYKCKCLFGNDNSIYYDLITYNYLDKQPIMGNGMDKNSLPKQYRKIKERDWVTYDDVMWYYIKNLKKEFIVSPSQIMEKTKMEVKNEQ